MLWFSTPKRSDMPSMNISGNTNKKELDDIKQAINDLTNMIESKHMRLEAILSQIIEREMITQDSYDKIMNLLIEFGKKKGWKFLSNLPNEKAILEKIGFGKLPV